MSDESEDVVQRAESLLTNAKTSANVEIIMGIAVQVGAWLCQWRKLMDEGGYGDEWIEDQASTLFHQFFTPFVPEFKDDDDHTSG